MTSQNQDKTSSKMNLKMRPLPDARSHAGGWQVSLVPGPRASPGTLRPTLQPTPGLQTGIPKSMKDEVEIELPFGDKS